MNPKTAIAKIPDTGSADPLNIETSLNQWSVEKPGGCLHCQRPTRGRFCCSGCEHVYRYIKNSGLSRYYSIRESIGNTGTKADIGNAASEPAFGDPAYFSVDPFIWKENPETTTFSVFVPTLSCAACLWLVRSALGRLPEVGEVNLNFEEKLIFIVTRNPAGDDREVQQQLLFRILQTLMDIGYRAFPPDISVRDRSRHSKSRKTMIDLAVSGAVFANVMLFSAAVYMGRNPDNLGYADPSAYAWTIEPKFRLFFDVSSCFLTGLSLVMVGRRFFTNAWNALKLRSIHIDQPIALALTLAYVLSVHNMMTGSPLLYFDSVAGLIFLLLAARAASEGLTERAKRLAESAIASIPPSAVKVGDRYRAAPGDIILADGKIVEGTGEVSEVALTGEATPVLKRTGDLVLAGSQNLVSALTIEASASAGDSYVQRIRRTIEATGAKPHLPSTLDVVLRWFVSGIFLATGLAVLLWWQQGAGRTIEVVCAVLIVSCPCALALAIPLARSFALKRAWSAGAVIKSGDALAVLSRVDTLVLDKTGTLTTGSVAINELSDEQLKTFSPDELYAVKILAQRSRHPVSVALVTCLEARCEYLDTTSAPILSEVTESPGQGLSGKCQLNGNLTLLKIGRADFIAANAGAADWPGCSITAHPGTVVEQVKHLRFTTSDPIRPDAARLIAKWKHLGLQVHILSGDVRANVAAVGAELGVKTWAAESLPENKQAYVIRLIEAGRIVAMVGDGINDAKALAVAHVGIAVKGGADLALSSADIFLARDGVSIIDETLEFSAYTQKTEKIVMGFGVIYNMIAIGFALAGFLHPLMAALIMPMSSLSVLAIAYLRKGDRAWKSSLSSCPLPLPLPG